MAEKVREAYAYSRKRWTTRRTTSNQWALGYDVAAKRIAAAMQTMPAA